jgi:hypothetical protein
VRVLGGAVNEMQNYVLRTAGSVLWHRDVFRFSGSGGGPHCAGGCPLLVGAMFRKTRKL